MNIDLSRFAYRRQADSLQKAAGDYCDAEQHSIPNRATSLASCNLFSGFATSKRQKRSCIDENENSKEQAKENSNIIGDEESPSNKATNKRCGRRVCARFIASDSDEEGTLAKPQPCTGSGMSAKRVRFSLLDDPIPGGCGFKVISGICMWLT